MSKKKNKLKNPPNKMVLELLSSNDTIVKNYIDSKNDHIISEGFLKNWDKNGKIDSVVVGTDYDSRKMRPYGKDTSLFIMDYFDFENNDIFNRSKRRYLENKILPVINDVSKKTHKKYHSDIIALMALYDTAAKTVRNEFETPVEIFGIDAKYFNSIINSGAVNVKWKKHQSYIHETKKPIFLTGDSPVISFNDKTNNKEIMITMAITPNKLFMCYRDVKLTDIKKNIGCIVSSYNKNVIERSKRFYVYP